ncbi:type III effector [Nocardioides sp. CCNWLW239]|uniref:type III effector n=1 Tax=Nocardioides sp. CCNWLW239 TaxID=3128902 RepID=UPI0030170233
MSKKTGMLRRAAAVAAFSGVAFALTTGAATAAPVTNDATTSVSTSTEDLSPSTQKAWDDFILGGSFLAGGLAQMASGAWIGAPGTLMSGATGTPMTPEQMQAWEDWNEGAHKAGMGAAMLVSGAYIGAPGYIFDKITGGATPGDLSPEELEQVSFLIPEDSPALEGLPLDQIPGR